MSNSIKVESLINRSLKVSAPISRKLFVSAPINRSIFVSSEMSVPIFAPPPSLIVTFDVGGPKVFIDNEDIPGFTSIMDVKKFGSATIEQTAGGKGKVTTTVGADTAYFRGKVDLVTKGTWEMVYKFNALAVGGEMDVFINDGPYSGNGGIQPSTYLVGMTLFFDGRVFARFRPNPGSLLPVGGVLTTYNIGVDGEIICSIGKTATDYTYDFNGATTSIPILSVQSHVKEQSVHGECCNGTTATAEFDDIEGID